MNDLLSTFKEKGALLEGHFILSSGLHSDKYLQSALLLQHPKLAEDLGRELAQNFSDGVQTVLSPALGGVVIGQEVARAKGARAIFSEKDDQGKPVLRRGFSLEAGEKVLVIEDVITTGLSTNEVARLVHDANAKLVGIGCLVNRSGKTGKDLFKDASTVISLLDLNVQSWQAQDCALCKKGVPAIKPGSRKK